MLCNRIRRACSASPSTGACRRSRRIRTPAYDNDNHNTTTNNNNNFDNANISKIVDINVNVNNSSNIIKHNNIHHQLEPAAVPRESGHRSITA